MNDINEAKKNTVLQHLTFKLRDEIFAFEISKIREVIDFSTVTKIPGTPDFMRGVINLRGSVVPVIDLQLKFGMGRTEKTINTCVIIVEVAVDNELTQVGALADSVQEVLDLETDEIEPPPRIGMTMEGKFIKGMGKHGGEFIIILDIEKIFTTEEINLVEDMKRMYSRLERKNKDSSDDSGEENLVDAEQEDIEMLVPDASENVVASADISG